MNATQTLAPPSRLLQWLEVRAVGEAAFTAAAWPMLGLAPRGDGHPVLVLPGLIASDRSTAPLRTFLRTRNYDVHGWGQGRNFGPREGVVESMLAQLDQLHASSGRKVSLVGWSLGGIYARMLANERPDAVRGVVTLGSPVGGQPRATRAWRLYEFTSGQKADDTARWQQATKLPDVPSSSIWSRGDGIVAWRNSLQPDGEQSENIQVHASHLGLGVNMSVLYAIADRLAQPEGQWRKFSPPLVLRGAYPSYRG